MNVKVEQLRAAGYCVLPAVFAPAQIARFRAAARDNLALMGQTRAVAHSYHLAGFHRFPALSGLHDEIAAAPEVVAFLSAYFGSARYDAIGLSDITVNRSQHWHTDLLRGRYSHFLDAGDPWGDGEKSCLKVLVYLQPGRSLKIVPGSHRMPTPLDDAALDSLAQSRDVEQLELGSGDVVMMDIRALHRGSADAEMARPERADDPKILVSTVFGATGSAFAEAMRLGNAHRTADWDRRHLGAGQGHSAP